MTNKAPPPLPFTAAHRRALNEAILRFGARPEVTAIDLGYPYTRGVLRPEMAVRIHVREKVAAEYLSPRELFPSRIGRLPVDVLVTRFRDHATEPPSSISGRRVHVDPVQPGVSIGVGNATGTLGALLWDNLNQRLCILGSRHVLYAASSSKAGDPVLQPGGADPSAHFATLSRSDPSTDAAIALLELAPPGKRQVDPAMYFSGTVLIGAREPKQVGDVLKKSGVTTGVTQGFVDGFGLQAGIQDAMRIVPLAGSEQIPLARLGDSGAVWYDPQTGEAVGLHCKGPDVNITTEFAVATRMTMVMANLDLDIAQFGNG